MKRRVEKMKQGTNEEKIDRIIDYWSKSGKPLAECIIVVMPDIKIEVLKRILKNNNRTGGITCGELSERD